jgi:hypothetical protein
VRRRPPKSPLNGPSHPSDSTTTLLLPTDLAPPFTAHHFFPTGGVGFALVRLHELDLSVDATLVEQGAVVGLGDLGNHIYHQQVDPWQGQPPVGSRLGRPASRRGRLDRVEIRNQAANQRYFALEPSPGRCVRLRPRGAHLVAACEGTYPAPNALVSLSV